MNLFSTILGKDKYVCIVILMLGFAVYSPVINGPFLFDDDMFIVQNKQVHSLWNIPQMLVSSTSDRTIDTQSNFYRPLQQIAYSFLYALFGANPLFFHLFSILLHSCNAFLLFAFFVLLLEQLAIQKNKNGMFQKNRIVALVGSILFLVHPINTEAVCYISGLADILGMFFMMICLLFFVKINNADQKSKQYTGITIAAFVLALLSKENLVIIFPVLFLLYFVVMSLETNSKFQFSFMNDRRGVLLGLFLCLTITYVILKFTVFNFTGNTGLTDQQNAYTESVFIRIATFIHVFPEYLKMIFFPAQLNYEKPYVAYTNLDSQEAALGFLSLITIICITVFAFIRKYYLVFFSLCWFTIALLPYTGIIALNSIYLEHWLYFPLVGFCLLIAVLLYQLSEQGVKLVSFALLFLFIFMSVRTTARAYEWADIEKFYTNELKYTKEAGRIYNNLAMYYADHKNIPKAIQYYEKAIQLRDVYPQVHYNLGNLYRDKGDVNKAMDEYYRALMMNPNFYYSLGEMVNICLDHNMIDKAQIFKELYNRASTKADVTLPEIEKAFSNN